MPIGASPVNVQWFGNVTSPQTLGFTPTNGNTLTFMQLVGPGGSFITSPVLTNVSWAHTVQYTVNRKIDSFIGTVSASAGTSFSWTSGAGLNGVFVEWAGLDNGWDSTNSAGASANLAVSTSASVTPVNGTNVLILAGLSRAGTFSSGPTNSFTDVTGSTSASRLAYLVINGASGAYSTAWTYTGANTYDTFMLILTAPGGGGTKLKRNSNLDGLGASGPFFANPLGFTTRGKANDISLAAYYREQARKHRDFLTKVRRAA